MRYCSKDEFEFIFLREVNAMQPVTAKTTFEALRPRYLEQEDALAKLNLEVGALIQKTDRDNDVYDETGSDIVQKHDAEKVQPFIQQQERELQAVAEQVAGYVKKTNLFKALEGEIEAEIAALEAAKFTANDFAKMKKHDPEKEAAFKVVYEADMQLLISLKQFFVDLQAHRTTLEGRIVHLNEHPLKRFEQRIADVKEWKDPKAHYWVNRGVRYAGVVLSRVGDWVPSFKFPIEEGKKES